MKTAEQMTVAAKIARDAPIKSIIKCPVCDAEVTKIRHHHMFCCTQHKQYYRNHGGELVGHSVNGLSMEIREMRDIANRIANRHINNLNVKDYDFLIDIAESYSSATKILDSPNRKKRLYGLAAQFGESAELSCQVS